MSKTEPNPMELPDRQPMNTPIRWTGHPLADVGVATLCAFVGKDNPEKLTLEDLDEIGRWMTEAYDNGVFMSYLTCVFPNSAYVNATISEENRKKGMRRLLSPHRSVADQGTEGLCCAFTGQPATHLLDRSQMPMLTGAGVMNFFPAGLSEMPVAAPYLLAIQALPLGGRRSEGKLLMVHCDDPEFTLQFAKKYLATNRRIVQLAQTNKLPAVDDPDNLLDRELPGGLSKEKKPKYPDAKAPGSLLMDDLIEIISDRGSGKMRRTPTSVTAYHLSNSGQGPSLAILHIPSEFVEFLAELHRPEYSGKWKPIVARAWRAGRGGGDATTATPDESAGEDAAPRRRGKTKTKAPAPIGAGKSRNELYNDLLSIFEDGFCDWWAAARFIRRHLLSNPNKLFVDFRRGPGQAPKLDQEQGRLVDWSLTALFLEKVLGMDKKRIEAIKEFATKLAELINEHNDRRLFRGLVFTEGEWQYRALLSKAQMQYAKDRGKLALGFEEYVDVFLTVEPDERRVWSLVRDLISIRLVEHLFELKFFDRPENQDALEEQKPDIDAA